MDVFFLNVCLSVHNSLFIFGGPKCGEWIRPKCRFTCDPSSVQFVHIIHFCFSFFFVLFHYLRRIIDFNNSIEYWITASFSSVKAIYKWFVMFCAVVRCVPYEWNVCTICVFFFVVLSKWKFCFFIVNYYASLSRHRHVSAKVVSLFLV